MIEPVTPVSWINHLMIHDSSLNFIKQNGSMMRFVQVDDDSTHENLKQVLISTKKTHSMARFTVPSHLCDLNRPDYVLNLICQSFPLKSYLVAVCKRTWKTLGFDAKESILLTDAYHSLETEPNGLAKRFANELRNTTGRKLKGSDTESSAKFSRDFANAVINCCADLTQGDDSQIRIFESWLRGTACTAAERRSLGIMAPIKRETATANLRSLLCLTSLAGWNGSILHLDIRSLTDHEIYTNLPAVKISKAKRIGVYQWLRELIDQVQFFTSTLIIVEVGPGFLDQLPTGKGVGLYDALKNRIIDDVSVNGIANQSAINVPLRKAN